MLFAPFLNSTLAINATTFAMQWIIHPAFICTELSSAAGTVEKYVTDATQQADHRVENRFKRFHTRATEAYNTLFDPASDSYHIGLPKYEVCVHKLSDSFNEFNELHQDVKETGQQLVDIIYGLCPAGAPQNATQTDAEAAHWKLRHTYGTLIRQQEAHTSAFKQASSLSDCCSNCIVDMAVMNLSNPCDAPIWSLGCAYAFEVPGSTSRMRILIAKAMGWTNFKSMHRGSAIDLPGWITRHAMGCSSRDWRCVVFVSHPLAWSRLYHKIGGIHERSEE
jgi:hypothetical protein